MPQIEINGVPEKKVVRGVHTAPFYHRVVDDFLPCSVFQEVVESAKNSRYFEKHSDLFHFYQTNELKDDAKFKQFLSILRESMSADLERIQRPVHGEEMTLFGSFYNPGHFLLPHDDCVEKRVLAFSFYLNDPSEESEEKEEKQEAPKGPNGELALYEEDGIALAKEIAPRPNRLVIFEVSGKSYHEVKMMTKGYRMALTGWLMSEKCNPESITLPCPRNRYWVFNAEESISIDLPKSPQLSALDTCNDQEWVSNATRVLNSLSWKRRLNCIYTSLEEPDTASEIPIGLLAIMWKDLVDVLVAKVSPGGYLLLNDPFNEKSDALAVLSLYEGPICIVDEHGEQVGTIEAPGYYVWPASGALFVPPCNKEGFIVAYRFNV
ncbi:prolyl 3-hydroxylase /prolyl 3,4-dihydroxylase [Nematocida major]|uniref:prolyl 3-hydroxylase /prolyl 3,4-dihydroxylase n=1 Tax=Nematocida major TaxID=1912982 RepID=UPI002007A2C9|nr:prolyl 3-hydroxylase /prolyl 3,4-dihydroxylase [Nematocida major]KAH9386323.1 prolyl 3-hydroxylase /prolyl 3,4-dihydroxylase [Nematocida major]